MTQKYKDQYQQSTICLCNKTEDVLDLNQPTPGTCSKLWTLLRRSFLIKFRNPQDMWLQPIVGSFIVVLFWAFFGQLDLSYQSIQNRNGVLFLVVTLMGWQSFNNALTVFLTEKALFKREALSKTYGTGIYVVARMSLECLEYLLTPIFVAIAAYFILNLNKGTEKFFKLYLVIFFEYTAGAGFGTFLSTIFPNIELAMALAPVVFVPLLIIGGGMYINNNSLNWYFRPIELISPFKYGMAAICINEFEGL